MDFERCKEAVEMIQVAVPGHRNMDLATLDTQADHIHDLPVAVVGPVEEGREHQVPQTYGMELAVEGHHKGVHNQELLAALVAYNMGLEKEEGGVRFGGLVAVVNLILEFDGVVPLQNTGPSSCDPGN